MTASVGLIVVLLPVQPVVGQAPTPVRLPRGVTPETKASIDRGLAFLARTQDRQGYWTNRGNYGEYPVAMTGLAGLALLMDGNTTTQGRYAPQVDRAVNYLMRSISSNGLIGRNDMESRPMYGHGFGMLFLSQLAGVTEDGTRSKEIQDVLHRGVQLTGRAQSRLGGWIYQPDSGGDEGSVTITQVQALRSCRNMGIEVPKAVIDKAMEYLDLSQNSDGGIRYTASQQGGPSRVPISAAAVMCWFNAGQYDNPRAKKCLEFCKEKLRPGAREHGHDYYAHLYWAQALYVSSDPDWDSYYEKRRDYLLNEQMSDGGWVGDGVGDVYGTAIALIILQLPYNTLPIMQK
jgi:squalene cyclase